MKSVHFKIFALFAMISSACTSNLDEPSGPPLLQEEFSETRSTSEILEIAQDAYGILNQKSRGNILLTPADIVPVRKSIGRADGEEPALYAVNYGGGQGFALVSSRRGVEPLIGLIENGDYDDNDVSVGPFNFMLDNAETYARMKKAPSTGSGDIDFGIIPYYDTLIDVRVFEPRVKVQWGQSWPENMFCPNKVAGCCPVALGQVLTFIQRPSEINITFNSSNERLALDWADISKHTISDNFGASIPPSYILSGHYINCEASENAHRAIGLLIRQLGHRMKADYLSGATAVSYNNFYNTTRSVLMHNPVTEETNMSNLYGDACKSNVVIEIVGRNKNADAQGVHVQHAWVIDGAFCTETKVYYVTGKGIPAILTYTEVKTWNDRYIHNNWGWCGYKNGYFLEGVYDLSRNPVTPPNSSEKPPIIYYPSPSRESEYDYTALSYIRIIKN